MGIVIVSAAGNTNQNTNAFTPQRFGGSWVLNVGAVDRANARAVWSADGTSASNWGAAVDLWAPGTDIATLRHDVLTFSPAGYAQFNGTSFAAPMVAGQAAVVLGLEGSLLNGDLVRAVWDRLISLNAVAGSVAQPGGSGLPDGPLFRTGQSNADRDATNPYVVPESEDLMELDPVDVPDGGDVDTVMGEA